MKYVDITAIIQVIGCIYQNPTLLDNNAFIISFSDLQYFKRSDNT